ncbi:trophoblast glycoprotein-like [Lethenteron reissneri]|uniref:trophoblast glycoprotein-like n=1 Tax=Lethenteron reissneri TaxID=7753 RepID=UPI002AB7A90E|nr:trophoblast glycoprotein-like [Lethenteron reissneri]
MATAPALCPLLLRALYPLLLLLLPPPSAASLGCPRTCVCDSPGGQLPVRCEKPPLSLPRDSVGNVSVLAITGGSARTLDWNGTRLPNLRVLNLSRSGIDTLDRASFPAPPLSLESLDLSDNGLRNISPEAFADLRELRTLELSRALHGDSASGAAAALLAAVSEARLGNLAVLRLSGNGIRELAPGTLSALRALEVLDLRRNALRRLSNATLEEMNSLPRLREVWLAGNAFVCDCHLAETVLWLTDRNRGRNKARDASSLVCTVTPGSSSAAAAAGGGASAGPTAVFNTTSLLSLQTLRGCAGEPVASYVLLGIVVALIGVIFLFVLYLNRRGIKKWLTHIRDACRDQIEEYNYRYELDANPRIANVVPPLEL